MKEEEKPAIIMINPKKERENTEINIYHRCRGRCYCRHCRHDLLW